MDSFKCRVPGSLFWFHCAIPRHLGNARQSVYTSKGKGLPVCRTGTGQMGQGKVWSCLPSHASLEAIDTIRRMKITAWVAVWIWCDPRHCTFPSPLKLTSNDSNLSPKALPLIYFYFFLLITGCQTWGICVNFSKTQLETREKAPTFQSHCEEYMRCSNVHLVYCKDSVMFILFLPEIKRWTLSHLKWSIPKQSDNPYTCTTSP